MRRQYQHPIPSSTSTSTQHLTSPDALPSMPFTPGGSVNDPASVSLSVNYLPSKFSSSLLSPVGSGVRKRKGWKGKDGAARVPKQGGGVDAFRSGEARMPGQGRLRLRWTRFKWIMFGTNLLFSAYALAALILSLLTWFNVFYLSDVVRTGNRTELIISTLAAACAVFTSLVGWAGILQNNRAFLAWYTFLLWPVFGLMLAPGYMTYKRRTFNLEGKVNAQWSRDLGAAGRLTIQNALSCCGYFSPFVEATVSQACYARSVLPGCKLPYIEFERMVLARWYTAAFVLVPVHMAVMLAALLCANHVTYRFGKGMMPEAYRLDMNSMAVIMENYANQLADQYGADIASEVLKRSRSNLQLDASEGAFDTGRTLTDKYEGVGAKAPEGI